MHCSSVKTCISTFVSFGGVSFGSDASVCVQGWVRFCVHLLLLELVGSEAFWINAPKDESHIEQDLAPGADSL